MVRPVGIDSVFIQCLGPKRINNANAMNIQIYIKIYKVAALQLMGMPFVRQIFLAIIPDPDT